METLSESPPVAVRRRVRRYSRPLLVAVVAFHLLLGGVAVFWVVSKSSTTRKLNFHAGPKSPNRSERALEHRVQLQKKMATLSVPLPAPRRILTNDAARMTFPPFPEVKTLEESGPGLMNPFRAVDGFGIKAGLAGQGNAGGNGAAINFFGIRDLSNSVIIMVDVSDSMFTRTGDAAGRKLVRHGKAEAFQAVRDEAIKLVQSLTPQTRFDIVRWAGSAQAWQSQLVPATDANKAAAAAHIQNEIDFKSAKPEAGKPGGTRHDYALKLAFSLKPETIYMLTDGNATAYQPSGGLKNIPPQELFKIAEDGQKTLPKKAHLHTIYYLNGQEKKAEREMLLQLAARNGGQFKTVPAKSGGG